MGKSHLYDVPLKSPFTSAIYSQPAMFEDTEGTRSEH